MSVVTGIMLVASCVDANKLPAINDWLKSHPDNYAGAQLVDVSDATGGGKHPQYMSAMGAGFNYMSDMAEQFPALLDTIDWDCPENVVLIIQPEEGTTSVFRPRGY